MRVNRRRGMRRGDGVGVARYAEQRRDGILVVEGVVAHGAYLSYTTAFLCLSGPLLSSFVRKYLIECYLRSLGGLSLSPRLHKKTNNKDLLRAFTSSNLSQLISKMPESRIYPGIFRKIPIRPNRFVVVFLHPLSY